MNKTGVRVRIVIVLGLTLLSALGWVLANGADDDAQDPRLSILDEGSRQPSVGAGNADDTVGSPARDIDVSKRLREVASHRSRELRRPGESELAYWMRNTREACAYRAELRSTRDELLQSYDGLSARDQADFQQFDSYVETTIDDDWFSAVRCRLF